MKWRRLIIIACLSLVAGLAAIAVGCAVYATDISDYLVKLGHKNAVRNEGFSDFEYSLAILFNPNNSLAYYSRGLNKFYLTPPDLSSAIADFDKSIAISPDGPVILDRARAKMGSYDNAGAKQDLDYLIKTNGDFDFEAYYYRGNLRERSGDWAGAAEDYHHAIKIYPEYDAAYRNLGLAEYLAGENEAALADLHKLADLVPTSESNARMLIWIIQSEEPAQRGAANAELRSFLDDPAKKPAPSLVPMGRYLIGETPEADFLKAIDTDPELNVRPGLCCLLVGIKNFEAGNFASALKFLQLSKKIGGKPQNLKQDPLVPLIELWLKRVEQASPPIASAQK